MDLDRSAFRLFVARSSRAVLLFGGTIFFARHLTPEELGAFFLFQALQGFLMIPADFGVRGALEKRLSEGSDPESMLGSALAFKIAMLLIVSTVIVGARGHINDYLGADLALQLAAVVVLWDLGRFFVQAIRGELRVGATAPIEFGRRLIWVGVGVVLVRYGFGVEGIVIGLICSGLITLVWAFWQCETSIGSVSVENVRSILAFSKYQFVASIGGRIYQWMDVAIIGVLLTQRYVGAYEVAWQVTLLVLLLSKSISLSIFPQISQWEAEAATARIEAAISTAVGFALYVSIPALVGGAIYAPEILTFIFGPDYAIAATVLVVLLVEKLFQSFHTIVDSSVRALNRPDLAARATVLTVGINLILSPLLIVSMGFVGAAVATTVSWVVNTALQTRYLSRFVTLDLPYRLVGWYAVASIAMGGVLIGVKAVVPVTGLPILAAQIGVGVAIYVGSSVAIPQIRDQIIVPGFRVVVS